MTRVRVTTTGLDELAQAMASADKSAASIAREEFAEMGLEVGKAIRGSNFGEVVQTRSPLRGGDPRNPIEADGIWPVQTGRSARSWKFRQRAPLRLELSSNARDPRSGANYSEYARKRGEPVGQGLENVVALGTEEFEAAAARVADRLVKEFG